MTEHPRPRRRPFAAPPDAAAAAGRLSASADEMRAAYLTEPRPADEYPVDEPPTGLLDLAAIRAALGQEPVDVNPAAARWLAGEDPADELPPLMAPEWDCLVLPTAYHSDGPCGPTQHPPPPEPEQAPVADVSVPDPEPEPVPPSPEPAPVPAVSPPPAPVFISSEPGARVPAWRSRHDERSRQFGMRRGLAGSAPMTDHAWPVGPVLDQGSEGACVGFGIVDAVNAMTTGGPDGGADQALALFRRADALDGDGRTGVGTSVLAGMQAGVEAGLFGGYVWCFGTRDVAQALLQRGPVVLGIPWAQEWFDLGPAGVLSLEGATFGDLGHCLAAVGISVRGPQGQPGPWITVQNSYGPGWGDGGFAHIHHKDLAVLLHGTGEAAVPTAQAVTP